MRTGPPGPVLVCRVLREAVSGGQVADSLLGKRRQRDELAIVDVHAQVPLRLTRGDGEAAAT